MSMPCFPDGIDISREEAFNMIIASIAMEEVGLSHIINAEGEKLQYVLGTLPGRQGACPTTQEILEVNKSVTALLDNVMQNQMVLKWKLDRVLNAMPATCPPPCPPCPPPCPCPPYPPQPPRPPAPDPCYQPHLRDSILLYGPPCGYRWNRGCRFPWRTPTPCCTAHNILWDPCDPTVIRLCAGRKYWLGYSLNVRTDDPCAKTVSVSLQTTNNNSCRDLFPYHFCLAEPGMAQTLSGTAILPPASNGPLAVMLALSGPGSVQVELASISIVEL